MKNVFSQSSRLAFQKFEEELRTALPGLPKLEAQVAQYMLLNVANLSFETGASLAEKVGVSEVTVSRLLRRLGYQGMRGLKGQLHSELLERGPIDETELATLEVLKRYATTLELEYKALHEVFQQCSTPLWNQLVQTVVGVDRVYVTGFQAVKGIAEDCARRLALTRCNVHFLDAHNGMITEWISTDSGDADEETQCLILIDVVPYAREAQTLAKLCNRDNRSLVVITDEMCYWAKNYTDLIIHTNTRNGLMLESTVAIAAALNLIANAIAEHDTSVFSKRLEQWRTNSRALKLF